MLVQPIPAGLAANALACRRPTATTSSARWAATACDGCTSAAHAGAGAAVFAAVLLAICSATTGAPLLLLAEGVRRWRAATSRQAGVWQRRRTRRLDAQLAEMTSRSASARRGPERLQPARGGADRLQTILDTLTAGVVVFDRDGRIDTVNPGATRILQLPLSAWRGRRLSEVPALEDFAQRVEQRFAVLADSPEPGERDQWQDAFDQPRGDGATLTLLVRGATLPDAAVPPTHDERRRPPPPPQPRWPPPGARRPV